jgi:hypothetical protein
VRGVRLVSEATSGRSPVERFPSKAPGGRLAPPAVGADKPAIIEPCPYCGATAGMRPITSNPKVRAWSCATRDTQWAISVVNPRLYLDRLVATLEVAVARSVLRQVIALADEAPTLGDAELRGRLVALAGCVQ